MHPDATAVYTRLWAVDSPTKSRDNTVTLTVRGKTTSQGLDEDAAEADRIARAMVPDAEIVKTFYTLFNHEPIRVYVGTSLTDLAIRRG